MLYKPVKIIAVDFDGTLVEHRYPEIGPEMPFAFEVLHRLQLHGHKLILWTYRSGEFLKETIKFCEEKGIVFYAVNENYPGEMFEADISRKIYADVYIDDRNIGGFPGWPAIYHSLHPEDVAFLQKLQPGIFPGEAGLAKNWFDRLLNKWGLG